MEMTVQTRLGTLPRRLWRVILVMSLGYAKVYNQGQLYLFASVELQCSTFLGRTENQVMLRPRRHYIGGGSTPLMPADCQWQLYQEFSNLSKMVRCNITILNAVGFQANLFDGVA